jgi:hypothetical protein
MMLFSRHGQRQVGIILSNKDNNIMATKQKYFKKDLSTYAIINVKSPTGETQSWARQLTHEEAEQVIYNKDWQAVREDTVIIEGYLINPDLDEAGYPDPIDDLEEPESYQRESKLKTMLENLRSDPTERASNTLGQAADILDMIRARQQTIEMPHTVLLNAKKYPDSASLENIINEMKQQHGDDAHILVSTTPTILAEIYLATLKNKETIGISSYPDTTKPLGVTLDPEVLEVIKKLRPKK